MNFRLTNKLFILLRASVWVVYAFYVASVISFDYFADLSYSIVLGGILLQMTIVKFLNNWYFKGKPLLLDYFRLATFLFIVLNCFLMLDNLSGEIRGFSAYRIRTIDIFPALMTIFVGLAGLQLSEFIFIYFKKHKSAPPKKYHYKVRNKTFFFIFSFTIGLLQLYLIFSGQVGYGTFQENTTSDISFAFQLVFILSGFLLALFAAMLFLYKSFTRKEAYFFTIYFGIQLLYGFLSGMKETVIVPVIIVLVPYIMSGRRVPKKLMYFGGVALLFIYPLNNNYRYILNNYPGIGKAGAFSLAFEKTTELSISENVGQGGEDFSDRLSLFPFLVYSVENESSWNTYKGMDRYIYLPVAWILPRIVIPDKPKSDTGGILSQQIYGYSTNSLTVTTYGWAYYEGGFFYVFVIFLLFGLFVSYYQFNIGTHTLFGLVIYIGLLTNLLKIESDVYFLITGFLQKTLTYYIFYNLLIKTVPVYEAR